MGNQIARTAHRTIITSTVPPSERNDRWYPVHGYEGLYEVDLTGRVRKCSNNKIIKPHIGAYGHVSVRLTKNHKRRAVHVARIMLTTFVGPPTPDKPCALHADDVPWNNDLSNLRWGSHSENMLDAVRNKTHVQARKTHCPRGHPYDEENTIKTAYNSRRCRGCLPMHNRLARQRRKEKENG